jgi:hypothetical protein
MLCSKRLMDLGRESDSGHEEFLDGDRQPKFFREIWAGSRQDLALLSSICMCITLLNAAGCAGGIRGVENSM